MEIINVIIRPNGKTANGFYADGTVDYGQLYKIHRAYMPEGKELPFDKEAKPFIEINFESLAGETLQAEILDNDYIRII